MPSSKLDPERHIPLTPRTLHILLALTDGPEHGYAIMKEVEACSGGRVTVGPGTLYEAIGRLVALELLEEVPPPETSPSDRHRRRFYALTPLGREVVRLETARLAALVGYAESKNLLSRG